MFWGVTLENDKRYTQTVEASFHISMAALDPNPPFNVDANNKSKTISLWLQHNKAEFLLCTLEYGKLYQQSLDYNITEGEEITFFVTGQGGVIHLTGFLIEDDMMSMAEESLGEENSSEEDNGSSDSEDLSALIDKEALAKVNKKRTKELKSGSKKKRKVENKESDESSSEDSDSADDDYDEVDDDNEDSEEASTEESDEDSDYKEPTSKKNPKSEKSAAKTKNPKKSSNPKEQKIPKKSPKNEKKNLANSIGSVEEDSLSKSFIEAAVSSEKKKKKKKKKDMKTTTTTAPETSSPFRASTLKSALSSSSVSTKSNVVTFSSGLVVEDLQVGQGAEARIGRQVHVYYSGKLAKNGKMFDSCVSGKPFRFTLGKGEVISGWEKGLLGLRVGGKRRLKIPAKLGYGSQKIGPIPPNSSLIFEIELKGIS